MTNAKRCVRCGSDEVALIEEWVMSKVHPPETFTRDGAGAYVIPDDHSAHAGNNDATGRWFFDCWVCGYGWTARGIDVEFA